MGYIAQCATIWLTVLIAFNRYVAICHPFKADRFLTIRTARIQVRLHLVMVSQAVVIFYVEFWFLRVLYSSYVCRNCK